jgi:hypothetical protein
MAIAILGMNNRDYLAEITSVTFNGDPLTNLGTAERAEDAHVSIWYLKSPDQGTGLSFSITFNQSLYYPAAAAAWFAILEDVNQTNTFGPIETYSGSPINDTELIVTSTNGDSVFGAVTGETTGHWSTYTPSMELFSYDESSNRVNTAAATGNSTGSSYTFHWTAPSPDHIASIGVAIHPIDATPPVINDFGVDDPGTGFPQFWANVTDAGTSVANVTLNLNGTSYDMNLNGTNYWTYQPTQIDFNDYLNYQISNASDSLGNHLTTASSMKNVTFNYDTIDPGVLDWEYVQDNNTFQANVTDSWGEIDTVIVNVTTYDINASMVYYRIFGSDIYAYMNNTLDMDSGQIYFEIIVNDTGGNTFTSVEHSGFVINHVPVASNLTLSRSSSAVLLPVYSNNTLYLNYTYSDPDNDPESGTEIRWYKNGVLQAAYNDLKEVPVSALIRGDEWNASVRPNDGGSFGLLQNTSTLTIQNTPPVVQSVTISPLNPLTSTELSISNTTSDADSDSIVSYQVRWFINSIYNDTYNDSTVISPSETLKGENWRCEIRAFDGLNHSSWYQSNTVIIGNSAPTASGLTITSNPQTVDDLVANWTFSDVDNDPESSNWIIQWYKWNGTDWEIQLGLENSKTVGAGNTTKDEIWYYTLQVYDGEAYSNNYTLTPNVQILNTPPTASLLTLTETPTTSDDLLANWNHSDVDGDSQPLDSWIIRWYKDGSYQAAWDDSITVPSSATSKGQVWNYTLQVHDGDNYSVQYSSPITIILNTAPTASNLMIPANPTSSDTLTASWTASDLDGDDPNDYLNVTILHWYKWNGTGWEFQVDLENSTTVGSSNLTRDDIWYYTLQIYDGESYSSVYSSANTTILNSLPTVSNVSFNKTSGVSTDDTFKIDYSYSDVDNDPEDNGSLIIHWYIKGVYNSDYDNQTIIYSDNTTEGDIWQYKIRVFDGFEYSLEYSSIMILIGDAANIPPTVISLNITTAPLTTDNIVAEYVYSDVDGINHSYGTPGTYEIFWYLNGTLQPSLNDSLFVNQELTSKHQIWNYSLRVFDGLNWSIQYNSSAVSVFNTPPQALAIDITVNPTTTTDLVASWTFSDADDDSEISYNILWYINGMYNSTYDNQMTIPAIATTKGETWNYTLQVYDGENDSILYASPQTIIQNTPPSASGLTLSSTPTTSDNLMATWSVNDVDPSDSLIFNITWYLYGQKNNSWLTSATSAALSAGNTSKNQYWYYKLRVYDGTNYSTIVTSQTRQIQNTAPEILGQVNITPSNPIRGTQLELDYVFYDIDDDNQYGTIIRWYRNGILQPTYNDLLKMPGGTIFKDDRWYAVVNVSDGTDIGIGVTSGEVIIGNTPPVVDSASIFPDSDLVTSNTLVANFESSLVPPR